MQRRFPTGDLYLMNNLNQTSFKYHALFVSLVFLLIFITVGASQTHAVTSNDTCGNRLNTTGTWNKLRAVEHGDTFKWRYDITPYEFAHRKRIKVTVDFFCLQNGENQQLATYSYYWYCNNNNMSYYGNDQILFSGNKGYACNGQSIKWRVENVALRHLSPIGGEELVPSSVTFIHNPGYFNFSVQDISPQQGCGSNTGRQTVFGTRNMKLDLVDIGGRTYPEFTYTQSIKPDGSIFKFRHPRSLRYDAPVINFSNYVSTTENSQAVHSTLFNAWPNYALKSESRLTSTHPTTFKLDTTGTSLTLGYTLENYQQTNIYCGSVKSITVDPLVSVGGGNTVP